MVFDSARGVVVMFGGDSGAGYLNDTWEWDGSTWTQRVPTTSPPPTAYVFMAYDATRAVTVMVSSATWEWDGTNWIQKSASRPAPSGPFTDSADAGTTGVMLLDKAKNWLWNGTTWTSVDFTATVPWTSGYVYATYDELRDRVLAIAWNEAPAVRMNIWEWTNGNWVQVPGSQPTTPWLQFADVSYDSDHGVVWMFGGLAPGRVRRTATGLERHALARELPLGARTSFAAAHDVRRAPRTRRDVRWIRRGLGPRRHMGVGWCSVVVARVVRAASSWRPLDHVRRAARQGRPVRR